MDRGILLPAGLGQSHGKSQLEVGCLRPPSPHGRGERPELQPSGMNKEMTYIPRQLYI